MAGTRTRAARPVSIIDREPLLARGSAVGHNLLAFEVGSETRRRCRSVAIRRSRGSWSVRRAGRAPVVAYHRGTFTACGPTLDYGQAISAGAITCNNDQSGMRRTDHSIGHFLRVSRESYELW